MIFWTKRRKVEALLAASLYEPLEGAERQTLDKALETDSRLRSEADALDRVRRVVRLETPEFTGDLLPLVRARLLELPQARGARVSWRWISGAAVAAGIAAIMVVAGIGMPGTGTGTTVKTAAIMPQTAVSPMKAAISKANELLASRDLLGARNLLDHAVAANPGDAMAGEAQALLADLEFSEFQRYPEAYAAYDCLRTRYPNDFMNSSASVQRFNLLEETRRSGYAPMYALDTVRNRPGDAFERCERIVAQYPDSMVAALAMNEMRSMVALPGQPEGTSHVMALERVRNRCNDPAAVAQVTLAMGNAYRDDLCDTRSARLFYNEAASSGHSTVAARAQEALAKLVVDAQ